MPGLWPQCELTNRRYATAYANVSPAVAYSVKYPLMTGGRNAAVTAQGGLLTPTHIYDVSQWCVKIPIAERTNKELRCKLQYEQTA